MTEPKRGANVKIIVPAALFGAAAMFGAPYGAMKLASDSAADSAAAVIQQNAPSREDWKALTADVGEMKLSFRDMASDIRSIARDGQRDKAELISMLNALTARLDKLEAKVEAIERKMPR